MARRAVEEINAGSMADIAFLLLIFFLVTTTIEVDAGISRTLPLKMELPPDIEYPEVNKRDVLSILANSNDQLLVEDRRIEIEELEEIVLDFYTANANGVETNPDMPLFTVVTPQIAQSKIQALQTLIDAKSTDDDTYNKGELEKWKTKLELCNNLPTGRYNEMSKAAIVQLKNQAGTSYGLYIQIQNILKKVVNDLRVEKCQELGWGNYFELKDDGSEEGDMEKIKMLRVLIPERIIEKEIDK
jgi:biopolymer transport protein ExbD